jgi:glycosyltransferase involved in cell wall biosynthesis
VPSLPSDQIRILILIKGLGIGGAETLIAESARLWDRRVFEYRVVFMLPWKDQLVRSLHDQGVAVDCLDWRKAPGVGAVLRLRRLCQDWAPHLIHSHLPAAGLLARLALPGHRHVYTEHNIVASYRQPTRWLNRATYNRNRAVIAVSEAVANSVQGYPGPKPNVIPNGVAVRVDTDQVSRVREELEIGHDVPLVVHVGNIRPHKGHVTLIESTRLLLKEIPEAVVVSLGGEKYQGDLARVRGATKEAGIEGNLRFMGRRHDARAFLAAADVVVNPADVEGLPVSVLEAMALHRPVVATAVGGVPSVVENEVTGLLVPPGNPEQLAAALIRALTSPEAKGWGDEAARLVSRDFGLDRMVAAYEDVYREVLGV